jgi:hypothetical protein
MLSILRDLYKNGDNDGNVIIKTKDKELKCHEFVISNTSDFFKSSINSDSYYNIIELDSSFEIVNIIMNYLYSEKIVDKELSANDIINLYNLINQLRCKDFIIPLKNHYLKKFPELLNELNWMELLKCVFNVNKYADFQDEILLYYKSNILTQLEDLDLNTIIDNYKYVNEEIKTLLFTICLAKILSMNIEIKNNIIDKNITTKQNLNTYLKTINDDSHSESEDEFETCQDSKKLVVPIQKSPKFIAKQKK